MITSGAIVMLAAIAGSPSPAQAAIADRAPYYMCFAYTPDGMYFAGGDFDLKRAQEMMATNCSMPKTLSVVLLKTLMVRRNGKIFRYAADNRSVPLP